MNIESTVPHSNLRGKSPIADSSGEKPRAFGFISCEFAPVLKEYYSGNSIGDGDSLVVGSHIEVEETPGEEVKEPPGVEVEEPPGEEVKEPPGVEVEEPPGEEVKEPPGVEVEEPPGVEVEEPPGVECEKRSTNPQDIEALTTTVLNLQKTTLDLQKTIIELKGAVENLNKDVQRHLSARGEIVQSGQTVSDIQCANTTLTLIGQSTSILDHQPLTLNQLYECASKHGFNIPEILTGLDIDCTQYPEPGREVIRSAKEREFSNDRLIMQVSAIKDHYIKETEKTPFQKKKFDKIWEKVCAFEQEISTPSGRKLLLKPHDQVVTELSYQGQRGGKKKNMPMSISILNQLRWCAEIKAALEENPNDKLAMLVGFWTDLSILIALSDEESEKYSHGASLFNWRKLPLTLLGRKRGSIQSHTTKPIKRQKMFKS